MESGVVPLDGWPGSGLRVRLKHNQALATRYDNEPATTKPWSPAPDYGAGRPVAGDRHQLDREVEEPVSVKPLELAGVDVGPVPRRRPG